MVTSCTEQRQFSPTFLMAVEYVTRKNAPFAARWPEEDEAAQEELRFALSEALLREQFLVYYQPIVSLASGRVRGAEAQIRWEHPMHGLMMQGRFMPAAERSGLADEVGGWVLAQACRQASLWRHEGIAPATVSIDLSPSLLARQDFLYTLDRVLMRSGLCAHQLELELSESHLATLTEKDRALLETVRNWGVGIVVDAFGTGHAPPSLLKELPVTALKLDQRLVRDLPEVPPCRETAAAVIALAHRLGLTVAADGVETREQAIFLAAIGCDYAQGNFYARPCPARNLEFMLRVGVGTPVAEVKGKVGLDTDR